MLDQQDESQFKKKVFCIHCANYYENRQLNKFSETNRDSTCIIMRQKQLADSPIKPAHVEEQAVYNNARIKNKNNDCKDFIPGLL